MLKPTSKSGHGELGAFWNVVEQCSATHGGAPQARVRGEPAKRPHGRRPLGTETRFVRSMAEFEQEVGNGNIDRAYFVARPAKTRCLWQIGVAAEIFPREQRAEHRTDGAAVDVAIGVAAGLPVNGTNVLAGSAADALQDTAAICVENVAPAVVQEDDVHLPGAVGLALHSGAAHEFRVDRELLASRGARQQIQKQRQIPILGNHLLDPDQGDVDSSGSHTEPGIALVGYENDATRFGRNKIGPGDPNVALHVV